MALAYSLSLRTFMPQPEVYDLQSASTKIVLILDYFKQEQEQSDEAIPHVKPPRNILQLHSRYGVIKHISFRTD